MLLNVKLLWASWWRCAARRRFTPCLIVCCFAGLQERALASFHFMQIEQVIGSVDGDTAAQAIQLRMRTNGQGQTSKARLIVWDAAGQNPVVLLDFTANVLNDSTGSRVLVATPEFAKYTQPPIEPDFFLAARIPTVYLSAGSITWENDQGTLLVWRFSWGGGAYTGSTTGALSNDSDGDFGPPFPSALPGNGLRSVLFQGTPSDFSTTNAGDYALTAGAAVFTNNAGASFTVTTLNCPNDPQNDVDHDRLCGDVDNCPSQANPDQADADGDGRGDLCDGCPNDSGKFSPGACGCGTPDTDTDGDGTADCHDGCPNDPNKTQPGMCGCGVPDADTDGDGALNCVDGCPNDSGKLSPGTCGCGVADVDADADGIPDCMDNCPGDSNPDQLDSDADSVGDVCDGCSTNPDLIAPGVNGCAPPDGGSTAAPPRPRLCGVGAILPLLFLTALRRTLRADFR